MFVGELAGDLVVLAPALILLALAGSARFRVAAPALPPRFVSWVLFAYLAVSAATIFVSIDTGTTVKYVVGSSALIALGFVALPALFGRSLLAAIAWSVFAAGVALAIAGLLLFLLGPVHVVGGPAGVYLPVELVVFGHRSGFTLPLVTGIYATPGDQAIAMALATIAGLALAVSADTPRRAWVAGGAALCAVALFLTFSRTGWIVVCCGLFVIVAAGAIRRQFALLSGVALCTFAALTALLLTSHLTVDARFDVLAQRYERDVAEQILKDSHATTDIVINSNGGVEQTEDVQLKGGADSSSRRILWTASLDAMADRPILGSGLGTDADAIAVHLKGDATVYRGLTSHSTVLRAGVEGGIALLALLVTLVLAALVRVARWLIRRDTFVDGPALATSAVLAALVPALLTETLLLGGLTLISVVWTLTTAAVLTQPLGVHADAA